MAENEMFKKSVDQATLKIIMNLMSSVEKACIVIESETKKECPIDQGILRASITHNVEMTDKIIEGSCFSPEEVAPYIHQGTGLYAKDGDGRKTPWVYVPGNSKTSKSSSKTYTWQEAVKTVAILRKKGIEAYATKGQKPNPFMDRARNKSMSRVEKILGGKE